MLRFHLLSTVALLSLYVGCARQPPPSKDDQASAPSQAPGEDQKLPFDRPAAPKNVLMPSTAMVPTVRSLPAGLVFEVRLRAAISSATAHSGDSFLAVLSRPIVMDGEDTVPAGTLLSGRVVTAKRSANGGQPGFLRLTLSAITIGDKQFPVESSSLFARGAPPKSPAPSAASGGSDIRLGPERELSFRLVRPLLVH
jgi:hypothetical protein